MKLLKVLNKDLTSPYQGFEFELGKKYVCDDFDTSDKECSNGFYAVDFNGIVYALNRSGRKHSVFEVEVGGRSKEFNQFKRRYEEITILRELAEDEIKEGLLACEEKEGYRVCEACYPVHPFEVNPMPLEDAKKLLEEWKKVRGSNRYSVWNSVWDSVKVSVWDSVWASVWDSVWDSVSDSVWESVRASSWAYFSSFFAIEFIFDFSPAVNLWEAGLVPSFDGTTWRLHTGKPARVVYEWTPDKECEE